MAEQGQYGPSYAGCLRAAPSRVMRGRALDEWATLHHRPCVRPLSATPLLQDGKPLFAAGTRRVPLCPTVCSAAPLCATVEMKRTSQFHRAIRILIYLSHAVPQ